MPQRTTAQLKSFNDANIDANGVNAITGPIHNTMNEDIIDSMVNKSTDSLSIVTNVYRSDLATIGTTSTQITFSTPLANANYQIVIVDPNGIGTEKPTSKLATGFKIKGLTTGDIIYFVILTN